MENGRRASLGEKENPIIIDGNIEPIDFPGMDDDKLLKNPADNASVDYSEYNSTMNILR